MLICMRRHDGRHHARAGVARRSRLGERDAWREEKCGSEGEGVSIDRFLPRASSLSTPLGGPLGPVLFLYLCLFVEPPPLRSALSLSSRATILYFAVTLLPRVPPSPAYSAPRVFLFPLFSSRILFFTILSRSGVPSRLPPPPSSLPLSFAASWDRKTQPNNRHRRLKPENSCSFVPLLRARSTCHSLVPPRGSRAGG